MTVMQLFDNSLRVKKVMLREKEFPVRPVKGLIELARREVNVG